MPKDKKGVQSEEVSQETKSTEAETETTQTETQEQTTPQFLTREEVQQMLTEERDKIKQSSRDISRKEIEDAQRRVGLAEDTLAGYDKGLGQLDPEQAELIRLRAESTAHRRGDAEEARRQQMTVFDKSFTANMNQFITSAGLDPNDKRIDWAEDVTTGDYLAKQQRILASVTKIQKDEAKVADDRRSQEFKDMEDRLRKDLGFDSVDTSTSAGVGGTLTAEQVKRMSPKERADRASEIAKLPLGLGLKK